MAKYEDYVGGIEGEIGEAAKQSDQRARDAETGRYIPERFANKDITDVIKSYEELEKLNSRQAQDLGSMRKTVDQLLDIQQQQASSPAQETSKPVSVDDLYENADEVLRRVVREESSNELTTLKSELDQLKLERKLSQLEGKFPDWRERVQEADFGAWVQESPYRQRMFQEADSGDFDAAEEILGMYYETNRRQEAQDSQRQEQVVQQQQLADAILESGSPAAPAMDETYSRNDLMEARLSAKRGDLKADRWLKAHADSIARAYEEGRIVD
jgi:hypothetical protein